VSSKFTAVSPFDIYASIDTKQLTAQLEATQFQVRTAAQRAVTRVRDWIHTQLAKEVAARMGTTRRVIKTRLRKSKTKKGSDSYSDWSARAVLWVGVDPIGVEKLNQRMQQHDDGVIVGDYYFPGAFVFDIYGWGDRAWKRLGRKRFPVIKMTVPMNPEVEEILPDLMAGAERMFEQRFEHELKYVTGAL